MNAFLQIPKQRRLLAFQQVDAAMGLQAVSVEKDFWVCWTLRELFRLPGIGEHLTFKGGTSLSKAWKLIERFSEDIDLVVDKEVLGFGGNTAPGKAPSNKQRKARLENLMDACRLWVQGTIQSAFAARITDALGDSGWKLEVDPEMADGQCLLFHYPSVFPAGSAGYVRPVVKIELGARSDDWPHETKSIQPYVIEHFSALDPEGSFSVRVLAAERTFWGKSLPAPRRNFPPCRQATKNPYGQALLRSLVSTSSRSGRHGPREQNSFPAGCRTPGNLLPLFLGGLFDSQARDLSAFPTSGPRRQLARRLPGNDRPNVFRPDPNFRADDGRSG